MCPFGLRHSFKLLESGVAKAGEGDSILNVVLCWEGRWRQFVVLYGFSLEVSRGGDIEHWFKRVIFVGK